MPWVCKICSTSYDQPGQAGPAPSCFTTPQCKSKGQFACTWQGPADEEEQITTDANGASMLGSPVRHNSFRDSFRNGDHKTNVLFVNNARTRAIAPDGSTHSRGREGWKGFTRTNGEWVYQGSYQSDLQPWPFRITDAQVAFPRG